MNGFELAMIREGLGLSIDNLADHLGVNARTVRSWQQGRDSISGQRATGVELLELQAADLVADHIERFQDATDPVMFVETGPDMWPAGWQRAIAFRVRQKVPGLRVFADEQALADHIAGEE